MRLDSRQSNDISPWHGTPRVTHQQLDIHQPMPLSPRSHPPKHTLQATPTNRPKQNLLPNLPHAPGASSADTASPATSKSPSKRASPLPWKASGPPSLPEINEPPRHLHPSGSTHTHKGFAASGPRASEVSMDIGGKLRLEPRDGSLAKHVMEHPEGAEDGRGEAEGQPGTGHEAEAEHTRGLVPELEARRRALAAVAFVRHSTADLQTVARIVAAQNSTTPGLKPSPAPHSSHPPKPPSMPHPGRRSSEGRVSHSKRGSIEHPSEDHSAFAPQPETWKHSKDLPGSLYAYSPEVQNAKEQPLADYSALLPPTTTDDLTSLELLGEVPPLAPRTSSSSASANEHECNLDGIGHPIVLADEKAAKALLQEKLDDQAQHNSSHKHLTSQSSHFHKTGHGLHHVPLGSSLPHVGKLRFSAGQDDIADGFVSKRAKPSELKRLVEMESTKERPPRNLGRKDTLPSKSRPFHAVTKGGSHISKLECWGNKRLNLMERKVDNDVYRLRFNTTAKTELEDRVLSYVREKEARAAEHAALTLFANERREQRTITFMQRQAQYSPNKASAVPEAIQHKQRQACMNKTHPALFDPVSGEPINDVYHLPTPSAPFWGGLTFLMKQAQKLGTQIRSERMKRIASKDVAARKIQAAWRGYRIRAPIAQLKRTQTMASEDLSMLTSQQEAADLIMDFLSRRAEASKREAAAAAMRATAVRARAGKSKAELMRGIRMSMMLKQWSKVEESAIEVSQKRTRGNAALGVTENAMSSQARKEKSMMSEILAARKKGDMPNFAYTDAEKDAVIKKATGVAMNRTFATDRFIHENWKPVPEPVKAAILSVFLDIQSEAYLKLTLLVWQARAKYKASKRARAHLDAARGVLTLQEQAEAAAASRQGSLQESDITEAPHARGGGSPSSKERGNSAEGGGREGGARSPSSDARGVSSEPSGSVVPAGSASEPQPPSKESSSTKPHATFSIPDPISPTPTPHDHTPTPVPAHDTQHPDTAPEDARSESPDGVCESVPLVHTASGTSRSRRASMIGARSRRLSVGYQARGRSRVERTLEVDTLLQEGRGAPELPAPKTFLTLMEMKAVMQQGVMETPMYNGFMLKGSMQDHMEEMNTHISKAFHSADHKTKKDMYKAHLWKAHNNPQGKNLRGTIHELHRRESQAGGLASPPADNQTTSSWTMALLTARWHAECFPRTQACLHKRLNLLKVDLIDCLMHGRRMPPEEMGQHLQALTL